MFEPNIGLTVPPIFFARGMLGTFTIQPPLLLPITAEDAPCDNTYNGQTTMCE